jgi:hypothetical protein
LQHELSSARAHLAKQPWLRSISGYKKFFLFINAKMLFLMCGGGLVHKNEKKGQQKGEGKLCS